MSDSGTKQVQCWACFYPWAEQVRGHFVPPDANVPVPVVHEHCAECKHDNARIPEWVMGDFLVGVEWQTRRLFLIRKNNPVVAAEALRLIRPSQGRVCTNSAYTTAYVLKAMDELSRPISSFPDNGKYSDIFWALIQGNEPGGFDQWVPMQILPPSAL